MENKLVASKTRVNPYRIDPDSKYQPAAPHLPDATLDEGIDAVTQATAPGWRVPRWELLRAHLPESRRARHERCQTTGVHLRRTSTATGWSEEGVYPMACGDIGGCPKCGLRYGAHKAADHAGKLWAVQEASTGPITWLRIVLSLPEWLHALKAQGCSKADTLGRLCPVDKRCRTCNEARKAYNSAAQAELGLVKRLQNILLEHTHNTGFLRVTNVQPSPDLRTPHLVVTFAVPHTAVEETDEGFVGTLFLAPNWAEILNALREYVTELGGTVRETTHETWKFTSYGAIERLYEHLTEHVHAPPLALAQNAAADSLTGVDPAAARLLTQAACLTSTTKTGKERRVQRITWCGWMAANKISRALAAIDVIRHVPDRNPAEVEILDVYRITALEESMAHVQSLRSGLRNTLPRALFKWTEFVDGHGRPIDSPERDEKWEWDKEAAKKRQAAEQAIWRKRKAVVRAEHREVFAREGYVKVTSSSKRNYDCALDKNGYRGY